MKLLGWMRHKLKKSTTEPFKEFITGNSHCLSAQSSHDYQAIYPNSCSVYKNDLKSLKHGNQLHEITFPELKFHRTEDEIRGETIVANGGSFHGFLTIGTLGLETLVSESATPTFGASEENITEGKEAVTENDLKFINEELEKFLEAEAEEECDESPGRSSQVSTITLSGKPSDGTMVCPLQGYLFGSSVELPETNIDVNKEKGSLAELFQRTRVESFNKSSEKTEMQVNKRDKNCKHLINKIFQKLHASSSGPSPTKADSVPKKKKFKKVLQMLRKKIHPENSIIEEEDQEGMHQLNNTLPSRHLNDKKNRKKRFFGLNPNNQTLCYDTKWPQYEIADTSLSGRKEQWIKTDAEYLVLEL